MAFTRASIALLLLAESAGALVVRPLILGNSYVYYNDLPRLVESLLNELPSPPDQLAVAIESVARPNYWLRQHVADGQPRADGEWSHLVLQEQSQTPGLPEGDAERRLSHAACGALAAAGAARGVRRVVLLQTWGRRDGDAEHPRRFPDFGHMQRLLAEGYQLLADEARAALAAEAARGGSVVEVVVAPAGDAFEMTRGGRADDADRDGSIFRSLYADDGAHPSLAGSYLAACVLAHAIQDDVQPGDLTYVPPELCARVAAELRDAAQRAVDAQAARGSS